MSRVIAGEAGCCPHPRLESYAWQTVCQPKSFLKRGWALGSCLRASVILIPGRGQVGHVLFEAEITPPARSLPRSLQDCEAAEDRPSSRRV